MLISAVQQSDSFMHTQIIYIFFNISLMFFNFFNILFHDGMSYDIEYSSLCSTVAAVVQSPSHVQLFVTPYLSKFAQIHVH